MILVSSSKNDSKWSKMAKTKIVQKTTYMWHSGPKGYVAGQDYTGSPERGSFCHFLILSHFLM